MNIFNPKWKWVACTENYVIFSVQKPKWNYRKEYCEWFFDYSGEYEKLYKSEMFSNPGPESWYAPLTKDGIGEIVECVEEIDSAADVQEQMKKAFEQMR